MGAFVVYDVTDEKSLEHSLQWKDEVDDVVRLENDDPIPVVLIANKVIWVKPNKLPLKVFIGGPWKT